MENETLKIFKRASDRAFEYDQPFKTNLELKTDEEPITDWTLITDGVIEFDLVPGNDDMLIKAVLVYKAFDPKTLLLEFALKDFESFISDKLNARYNRIPKGGTGWFGKPVLAKLTYYDSEKVEFILKHERNMDLGGLLNRNDL